MDKAQLKNVKKGMNADQAKTADYFFSAGGCGNPKICPDSEYDALVLKKLNELGTKEKALGKIGMDEDQVKEIAPVKFHGWETNVLKRDLYGAKKGNDGKLHTSTYSCTWLFFSDSQVFMYNVMFDMLSDSKKEHTEEYFYKDITNFSTSSETVETTTLHAGGCGGKKIEAKKESTETSMFKLIVPGDSFMCAIGGVADAEQLIQGMKQKLREKKQA